MGADYVVNHRAADWGDAVLPCTGGDKVHRVAHSLPFEQMDKSHELIEQGGFGGCVVVNID